MRLKITMNKALNLQNRGINITVLCTLIHLLHCFSINISGTPYPIFA